MRSGFLNTPEDVQWLKDTALKGCTLPAKWESFKSFVLQGNEDAPHAVNLYLSDDPRYVDDYYRVSFNYCPPIYAVAVEYCGETDQPYGGFSPI